jgi:hypothetical protein
MNHSPTRALAGILAASVLLAGCSSQSDPGSAMSPSAGPSAGPSSDASVEASASPTSTLSAQEQQAVDEAAEAVLAYAQAFYDIFSDPTPNLNDMNNVAAQPQLALDLKSLQTILSTGETSLDKSGPVLLTSFEPLILDAWGKPPTVILLACVDRSANSGTESGKPWIGRRQQAQYRVVKTAYLPAPGWAVAEVLPPDGYDQPQPC